MIGRYTEGGMKEDNIALRFRIGPLHQGLKVEGLEFRV